MALKSYCIIQVSSFLLSLLQDMTNDNSNLKKESLVKLEKLRNVEYWKLEDF